MERTAQVALPRPVTPVTTGLAAGLVAASLAAGRGRDGERTHRSSASCDGGFMVLAGNHG